MAKSERSSSSPLLGLLLLLAFASAPCLAQEKVLGGGPVVITAASLVADRNAGSALFEGSVVAESGQMTLYSERMKVYYDALAGVITRIEADGGVKLAKGGQVVVSERAVYQAKGQTMTFTGNPKAMEAGNIVTGTKIVYLLDEERYIVEGSRVILEQKPREGKED